MLDYQSIIDKYYESGSPLRAILIRHSRQVANKALSLAKARNLQLDASLIEAAAMLHDIGIFLCDAPSIECHGTEPYIKHGVLGAQLLRDEGVPEEIARVAERHTGAGLDARDIESQHLPLPPGDYMPQTQIERLICYADKFFSKSGQQQEKSLARVRQSLQPFGQATMDRFEAMHAEFA